MSEVNLVDYLKAMKKALKTQGWCKGVTTDVNGALCLMGAAYAALNETPAPLGQPGRMSCLRRIRVKLNMAIESEYPDIRFKHLSHCKVEQFNDRAETKKEDVFAVLDKAIAMESEK